MSNARRQATRTTPRLLGALFVLFALAASSGTSATTATEASLEFVRQPT